MTMFSFFVAKALSLHMETSLVIRFHNQLQKMLAPPTKGICQYHVLTTAPKA